MVQINRRGEPPFAPTGFGKVRRGWRKFRITDISVVKKEQVTDSLDELRVLSTPLLVVEAASPESVKRDYRYKRDLNMQQQVTIIALDEGLYEETVFTYEQELVLPTFLVILKTLFFSLL